MALGCLTLGVLELLWPAGGRRRARPRAAPAGRPVPGPAPRRAPVTRPAPVARPPHGAPAVAPERLVALVERARAEPDPSRRQDALRIAILTLERWRAIAASPDAAVTRALERARSELWEDYQQIALRRLAAAMPWRATSLGGGTPAGALRG